MNKSFDLAISPSSDRNKDSIANELIKIWKEPVEVLEIGCGTGQHCLHFVEKMPYLKWLPTDTSKSLPQVEAWLTAYPSRQISKPEVLDFLECPPPRKIAAAYSANTFHIMSWESCLNVFRFLGESLSPGGLFVLYGPFRCGDEWFGEGNKNFHKQLQDQDSHMGIRKLEDIKAVASSQGITFEKQIMMPANNQLLIWKKR